MKQQIFVLWIVFAIFCQTQVLAQTTSSDCSFITTYIANLENQSISCYSDIRVTQLEYQGNTYFRTYRGRTRASIETISTPCFAQENFGNIRDCSGAIVCRFSNQAFPPDYDFDLCNALREAEETLIWEHPESTCSVDDPFSLPFIERIVNSNPTGEECFFIEEIVQIDYAGFTYFKVKESVNTAANCGLENIKFYDCEGAFVGGIGDVPLCQSLTLCRILESSTGTVIWTSNDNEESGSNEAIFSDYPWLTDLVNPNTCSSEKVAVYQTGIYTYLLVTDVNGSAKLYNQDGQFYCQNTSNYNCVTAYNLGNPIDTWTCGQEPLSVDCPFYALTNFDPCDPSIKEVAVYEYRGRQYLVTEPTLNTEIQDLEISALDCETGELFCAQGELLASNPEVLLCGLFFSEATKVKVLINRELDCPVIEPNCAANSGTIFFENCDDGTEFFFIRKSGTGEVLDAYFDTGVEFEVRDGQQVIFDYVDANFSSPCSIADKAVTVTCISEISTDFFPADRIFLDYKWLTGIIDADNCSSEKVAVYQSEASTYLLVTDATGTAKLYNKNGVFYCENSINFDCLAAYNLGPPIYNWSCQESDAGGTSVSDNCTYEEGIENTISQIGNRPLSCSTITKITKIEYDGNSYFRTYVGRTKSSIEQLDFPCAVQEYFGDIKDCEGNIICEFALRNPPPSYDAVVCDAIQSGLGTETTIWENPESTCSVDDPFSLPFIERIVNSNSTGEECIFVEEIAQIDYAGFTYFRVKENFSTAANCGVQIKNIKFYDCEGAFVGGIGDVPFCQSRGLCVALETAEGTVIWSRADSEELGNIEPNCAANSGTIFFENCDDGTEFFFIRKSGTGEVFDAYFDTGVEFEVRDGQQVIFDYVDANFSSPCSITDKAVIVTCIIETSTDFFPADPIFLEFPWLTGIIDASNCVGEKVTVYSVGGYAYVYVRTNTGGQLYFQDGTFYCQDTPHYNCRSAYGLTTVVDEWACSNLNSPQTESSARSRNNQATFTTFPNPTQGSLTIELSPNQEGIEQLQVIDLYGRILKQEAVDSYLTTIRVDLSEYQNGIYYIALSGNGQRMIKRVVKEGLN